MSKIKTRPFDMANYLTSDEDSAEYLRQVMEDGDPALLAAALGDIAKARGMTLLARDSGLSRESLYRALSPKGNPTLRTLRQVVHATGMTFASLT